MTNRPNVKNRRVEELKRARRKLAQAAQRLTAQKACVFELLRKGADATEAKRKLGDMEAAYWRCTTRNNALTRSLHEALLSTRA